MEFDAYAQPGNSGSPVLNSKHELIGILYAGSGKDESEKNFGVYFTPQLKEFIQNNIENKYHQFIREVDFLKSD